ncbi:HupE/UreJ family protein [Rhodoferax sp.]|uniref:HupE/UreJ family protein n=1 Tax=Rhodoferax sp. TaxID=50421 RepID=UPI0025DF2A4B|nr:HupE/UreJ family protein [Rhodoferax sp.]
MNWRFLCFWLLSLWWLPAQAHKASDSYLILEVQGAEVRGQWDIALRDIDFAIGLDANGDGKITWGEVRSKHTEVEAWSTSALTLSRGGACRISVTEHLIDEHTDGAYAVMRLQGQCPASAAPFQVNYRLLFGMDALHRGLLRLNLDGQTVSTIFSPESSEQEFASGELSGLSQFGAFLVQGVWHIWIGFDHILFLLALLLPVVLVRSRDQWSPISNLKAAGREVLWVVTAFTVAHSITLTLAALQVVELPSRWVESVIALSVVLAAANNLYPVVGEKRWVAAFLFGLIHGFGFASVLSELGLPSATLVISLVGFNVGVELGQLAIVAVFLPLAFALRKTRFYQKGVFAGGSALTMVLALVWLVERAFDLKWITA